ncbi:hypothetical protein D5086_015503 [Populus alba]|uniref:Uncharacterized protein n=1 Tax=Populus alba TaxID=43335 RepID=A0ACC4BRZ1_POPAL
MEEIDQTPPSEEMQPISVTASASPSSNPSTPQVMSLEERFQLVRSVGEECIQEDELRNLLDKKPLPICYDGFEPSGRMHIAQGVMKTINVNKLTKAGCKVKIWIADWFAQLNNKMGGDLKKIKTVGEYLIEIWKAVGMDIDGDKVEFLWSSDEINSRAHEYWPLVMDIARRNKLPRIMRCVQIMGRSEQDELTAAQIFYPCMQCADIFFLKADICQLGMDQRKVNVLAREYCDDIKRKNKPIILSHHMLPGLQQGQEKMSKSDPSSSIFMEDEEAEVKTKIKKAYCPPQIVEGNPCLEYINYIIFPWFHEFKVECNPENGGEKVYKTFEELVADYESGGLHPGDLKPALAKALNTILQPVRDHFSKDPKAKDLLKRVKGYRVTRTCKKVILSCSTVRLVPISSLDGPGSGFLGGVEMSKSCKGLAMELVKCLSESDCIKIENRPYKECAGEKSPSIPSLNSNLNRGEKRLNLDGNNWLKVKELDAASQWRTFRRLSSSRTIIIVQASSAPTVEDGSQNETDAIPTPKVIIDQDSDPDATVVEITFGDRLGALLDTMNALKNLGLNVVKANVFLDSSGKHNTFAITKASTGRKVDDPELLEAIRLTIINNLLQYHPESSSQLAMGVAFGVEQPKQVDVDIATRIKVKDDGPDRSLFLVETADRPGLLVDLVKIITDINISVESGEFDTEGLLAKAKFHVSYKGKAISKPLQLVLGNSLRYFLRRPTTEEASF